MDELTEIARACVVTRPSTLPTNSLAWVRIERLRWIPERAGDWFVGLVLAVPLRHPPHVKLARDDGTTWWTLQPSSRDGPGAQAFRPKAVFPVYTSGVPETWSLFIRSPDGERAGLVGPLAFLAGPLASRRPADGS